ncbi:unnamed protein product [Periconia digitata]|uniref:PH domain-containing protein n=1 Tax=Periconia digitata TaxID=1303443 RepID=A0A9W4UEY8_9PLEO|nr:unnamed protein product [Periconia digitata]
MPGKPGSGRTDRLSLSSQKHSLFAVHPPDCLIPPSFSSSTDYAHHSPDVPYPDNESATGNGAIDVRHYRLQMATTANHPPGAHAVDQDMGDSDPFVNHSQDAHRQRYAAFDNTDFSLYVGSSPEQAKKALQAHLAETTRRLQETSHLGNALVQQRKELEERLQEVGQQEKDAEIGPELRTRLAELEKEFNEVGRETARAFLPKSRVPSGEPDANAGASVFTSEAQNSPSKVSVPSRKQRNQQPSRMNDIALATEISTSLLAQLKDLQAVLLEKDEALKAADLDRSQLEIEVEGLSQRMRTLDESESRLKDVNWNLETQVREFEQQSKAHADKENRLNHAINLTKTEKATLEREFEELKQNFAKLSDEQTYRTKQHETELSGLRRNVSMGETERGALQRKMEEMATQNQELAKAVAYRMRSEEQTSPDENSPEEGADEGNTITPEHSPPPSPTKATPRHGQLESETLKHSLNHAHRMIQQLKNTIHREKTEKMEIKRMLQETRDELETNRNALNGPSSASKRRKADKDVFKKPPRPDRLGAFRMGSQEVILDEDEWEEHDGTPTTPSKRPKQSDSVPGATSSGFTSAAETSTTEGFETANETSDAAFETANERDGTATETDAFQTGAETLDGNSSDDLTETEAGPSGGTVRRRPNSLSMSGHRDSYESTASTSGDEWDDKEVQTPVQAHHQRYRLKVRQGYRRSITRGSADGVPDTPPAGNDSPASFAGTSSNRSTPVQGKSLFAELGGLSAGESEDGSVADGTPSRSSVISPESSPEVSRKVTLGKSPLQSFVIPKTVLMVDSSVMTDPWEPAADVPVPVLERSSIWSQNTEPNHVQPPALHISSVAAQDTVPQAAPVPSLGLAVLSAQGTEPQSVPPPSLAMASFPHQTTEPRSVPPPSLAMASFPHQTTEPRDVSRPALQRSLLSSQNTIPQALPAPSLQIGTVSGYGTEPHSPPPPAFNISTISGHDTVPQSPPRPTFSMSSHWAQGSEPSEPTGHQHLSSPLNVSTVVGQATEPVQSTSNISAAAPLLAAGLASQMTEPSEPSEQTTRDIHSEQNHQQAPFSVGSLSSQTTVPGEPPQLPPIKLDVSDVFSQSTVPAEIPRPRPHEMSSLSAQNTAPVEMTRPARPQLSSLSSQTTLPVESAKPARPQFSSLSSQATQPVQTARPSPPQFSGLAAQSTRPVEIAKPAHPQLSLLTSLTTEPISSPLPAAPQFSGVSHQHSLPVEAQKQLPAFSTLNVQHTDPVEAPVRPQPKHTFSEVAILHDAQPESPTLPTFLPSPSRPSTANRVVPPTLGLSDIASHETAPNVPSRPVTAHRTIPQDTPLGKVEQPKTPMADGGTQTMVSSEQIDRLLMARSQRYSGTIANADVEKAMSPPASPSKHHANEQQRLSRRSSTSSSIRSRSAMLPPLPADHKEVIAAASLKSPALTPVPPTTPGPMGPPIVPASAYKKRPQTPVIKTTPAAASPKTGGTTPRPRPRSQPRSGAVSPVTRRSSISSFSSEIDHRFNIAGMNPLSQTGLDPAKVDPRMIQAITQTMLGEFMWKYTRRTGQKGMSQTRHRRYFWVHPFTRTVYWSKDGPARGTQQVKAKSLSIEGVHTVGDNNPLPPGLHHQSIVITTPGREIQFTAPTSQRHETWLNALLYLLQRTDQGPDDGRSETEEIQDEFNPGSRSISRQTGRSRASYVTHSSHHSQYPTLRQSTLTPNRPNSRDPGQGSGPGRLSTMFRSRSNLRGSFSSRFSKSGTQEVTGADGQHDMADSHDLGREMWESHESADNMEDVRACCNGKHHLHKIPHHHNTAKNRHHSYNTGISSRPSFIGSISSRAQSRTASRTESRTVSRTESHAEVEGANNGAS